MSRNTFLVLRTPSDPIDRGDNDHYFYSIQLDVKTADRKIQPVGKEAPVERIDVAMDWGPFGSEDCEPSKNPHLRRFMDIKEGDELIVEYDPKLGIQGMIQANEIISLGLRTKNSYRRLRGIPIEWLFFEMIRVAASNGIGFQAADTWAHSTEVYRFSKEISGKIVLGKTDEFRTTHPDELKSPENRFDNYIMEKGCYAHDFGRMITGSDASRTIRDGALHGFFGAKYFREMSEKGRYGDSSSPEQFGGHELDELERLARICERHLGGSGLTASSMNRNSAFKEAGIPPNNLLAESTYERIIGYADWRTHARKGQNVFIPTRVSEDEAMERTVKYNPPQDQLDAVKKLCDYIHFITDGAVI